MTLDEIEQLEEIAMSIVVQAISDYSDQAKTIFTEETDSPQDIAEDLTREALESMGLSGFNERLYGKVDVKKAVYVFMPAANPVALMVDSKAERANGDRTATIQMSQTSMRVRMYRSGQIVDEPGRLDNTIVRGQRALHVVTIVVKYAYEESPTSEVLRRIIIACIPNGKLQDRYNPSASDGIWLVGRDAPSRGEDFRVRLSYERLRNKASWRVQEIH